MTGELSRQNVTYVCQFLQMYIDGPPGWEKVSDLQPTKYINYTGVIEEERLPAIPSFTDVVREA